MMDAASCENKVTQSRRIFFSKFEFRGSADGRRARETATCVFLFFPLFIYHERAWTAWVRLYSDCVCSRAERMFPARLYQTPTTTRDSKTHRIMFPTTGLHPQALLWPASSDAG